MQIINTSFLIGAVREVQYPQDGYTEIALCGRSNVGKSSLINTLINRKNLARTSSQPGKTQQLNYYAVTTDIAPFYFVDLPGYGFAKVSKSEREKWGKFSESYLLERSTLKCIWQIVDMRHKPSQDDIAMYEWLIYHDLPVKVIATKVDKISKGQWQKHGSIIQKALGLQEQPILFSSETKYNKDKLLALIESLL